MSTETEAYFDGLENTVRRSRPGPTVPLSTNTVLTLIDAARRADDLFTTLRRLGYPGRIEVRQSACSSCGAAPGEPCRNDVDTLIYPDPDTPDLCDAGVHVERILSATTAWHMRHRPGRRTEAAVDETKTAAQPWRVQALEEIDRSERCSRWLHDHPTNNRVLSGKTIDEVKELLDGTADHQVEMEEARHRAVVFAQLAISVAFEEAQGRGGRDRP